jgi:hypothetical protein
MLRLELIEVGTRVAYEDMANPRREGVVLEILEHGDKRTPSGLPIPGGTEYRIGWDSEYGWLGPETISDLRQHGWTMLAALPGSPFDGADIISVYTRLDAIRDGVLVPLPDLVPDEPNFANEAGIAVPVDLTRAVAELVTKPKGADVKGRLWDVLHLAAFHGARVDSNEIRYAVRIGRRNVRLKAVVGPDQDGSPVMTFMLPEED